MIRDELFIFLKEAKKKKVEIWLWPLLTKENGYWFNQWNCDSYSDYTRTMIKDFENEGVIPAGVSMDLEPPPEVLADFLKMASKLQIKKLIQESNKNINLPLFEKMRSSVAQLSAFLHSKGLKTHAVSTPFV